MIQHRFSLIFFVLLFGFLIHVKPAVAQLQIAPTAVYMGPDNSTERVVIRNSSDEPIEVEIELLFGYPATDDAGKVFFKQYETIDEDHPSAVDWIRIYPRFFELAPGQRQTVRFAARPPADLDNREYWARPAVVAQTGSVQEEGIGSDISTQINMKRRTILALNYRNGEVSTGISIDEFSAEINDEKITLSAQFERLGNAAYLGHYNIRLYDSANNPQDLQKRELAVYNDQKRTFEFDKNGLAPGTYRVELEAFTDERSANGIIQASPASATTTFTIP